MSFTQKIWCIGIGLFSSTIHGINRKDIRLLALDNDYSSVQKILRCFHDPPTQEEQEQVNQALLAVSGAITRMIPLPDRTIKGITQPQMARFLLRHGADPNYTDYFHANQKPLLAAADKGRLDTVIILLHYGANIHAVDHAENNALMRATNNNHTSVMIELLRRGAIQTRKQRSNPKTRLNNHYMGYSYQRPWAIFTLLHIYEELPSDLIKLTLAFDGTDSLWSCYQTVTSLAQKQ